MAGSSGRNLAERSEICSDAGAINSASARYAELGRIRRIEIIKTYNDLKIVVRGAN
ncbi:hypothetical protein ACO2JO_04965 [Leptospira interrogans]